MASSGMLRRVALVISDISEDFRASIIRVTRIGELGTLAVTSNWGTLRRNRLQILCSLFLRSLLRLLVTSSVVPSSSILVALMKEALSSCKTSVLTRATALSRYRPRDGMILRPLPARFISFRLILHGIGSQDQIRQEHWRDCNRPLQNVEELGLVTLGLTESVFRSSSPRS
jgi:hypothetical protein